MKFLVDAQLPHSMVSWLMAAGSDAVHTLDLPQRNRTPDDVLISFADDQQRVLVTKDRDFVDTHILRGQPARLLLIATGNISNRNLEQLIVVLTDYRRRLSNAFVPRTEPIGHYDPRLKVASSTLTPAALQLYDCPRRRR